MDKEGNIGAKSKVTASSSPHSRRTVSKVPRPMKVKEDFSWVDECLIIKPCILHPRPKFVRPKIKYPKFGRSKCIVSVQEGIWHGVLDCMFQRYEE